MSIPKRPRTCRVCKSKFQPYRCMQQACSYECEVKMAEASIEKSKAKRAKDKRVAAAADRKVIRNKKAEAKPLSYWRKRAQAKFNRWVRLVKCAGMPCISCGRHHGGQKHAGHYQNLGDHPELSFEPDNVWLQCKPCNTDKHGNIIEYRKSLVAILGVERVEWLDGPHELPHRRKEDYQAIEAHYGKLLKEAGL